jgi:hypothetical protein
LVQEEQPFFFPLKRLDFHGCKVTYAKGRGKGK